MGFSMIFMRFEGKVDVGADRDGLKAFLRQRDLEIELSAYELHHLRGPHGALEFDGHRSDLHLSDLNQEEPVSGGIWHASLSRQECAFIFDLCVAGRMLAVNPQGDPTIVVPIGSHGPEDLAGLGVDPESIAWVANAEEFEEALTGSYQHFANYRDHVIREAGNG